MKSKEVTLKYQNDENLYTLTRSQFAEKLGKSIGSVKQDMRRGKYKDQYIFKNGQYFFKPFEAMRENMVCTQIQSYPVSSKKELNRGNHFKAKYPNQAFKQHNELKMLLKLKEKISDERAEEYVKDYKKWEQHKANERQKQVRKSLDTTSKNYGGLYNVSSRTITWETPWKPLETQKKDEYQEYLESDEVKPVDWSKKYY